MSDATWVEKRSRCTLAVAMSDLRECAKAAVKRINEMLAAHRGFPFEMEGGNSRFEVQGWPIGSALPGPVHKVAVALNSEGNLIRIESAAADFCVFQKWDVRREGCILYVDHEGQENEYTADQIIQLALEPLFFLPPKLD